MEWLRSILINLPLDDISDKVSQLTIWWSNLVADVPPDMLPIYAYVGFSVVVLLLWLFIVRVLPSPLGGMSWLAVFSILLAPGSAAGDTGEIAPASIGVIYGILMKDPGAAMRSLLPILVVFSVGLALGFIWQLIKNSIEKSSEQARQQAAADERANLQMASANYIDLVKGEEQGDEQQLVKQKRSVPTAEKQTAVVDSKVENDLTNDNSVNSASDKKAP